ncbi:MAG: MFS transporter [Caldithrix sp.]|nr:MFS transporter [Caldithrix sp.]
MTNDLDQANQQKSVKRNLNKAVHDSLKELKNTVKAFVKAPRALWGVNIPFIIEGLVYFGILNILGIYCSVNVDLSDLHAGWVYSGVTGGITFAMLLLGGVSDKIGVRRSLILALSVMMIGRIFVALSGTIPLGQGLGSPMFFVLIFGLLLMVTAYGLYQPAAYAGVKRYTTPKNAAMGYAVIYGLMNLGAFLSGFISPFTRHAFESVFPPNGLPAVFWVYTFLTLVAVLSSAFILTKRTDTKAVERVKREKDAMRAAGEDVEDDSEDDNGYHPKIDNRLLLTITGLFLIFGSAFLWRIFNTSGTFRFSDHPITNLLFSIILSVLFLAGIGEYLRKRPDHPFRDTRFTFFIFILIPVQTLFAHQWLTMPYYLERAFHGSVVSEYFEFFNNLNPILIFFLAPFVAGITARANVYKMMILGTFVMALPTFLLAIGPHASLFLTYILLMTTGEAIWQPRFLQWIAEIAPKGKTGAYMGIGQLPWFLTKVVTGFYSGYFVSKYIPEPSTGLDTNSGEMWLIYAFIAITSPIALVLAKKWMQKGMRTKAS